MLSEDYFGFKNQQHQHKKNRKMSRTQRSHQRLRVFKNIALQHQDNPIEQLRNKYNDIQTKQSQSKTKKSKTLSLSPLKLCYHSMKLKYFHYQEHGTNNRYREIRRKFEKRVLVKAKEKIGHQSPNKNIQSYKKRSSNQEIPIPNLMKAQKTKGRHHQDFSLSELSRRDDSYTNPFTKSRVQKQQMPFFKDPNHCSNPQIVHGNQQNIGESLVEERSYLLGTQTIKKQSFIKDTKSKANIKNEVKQSQFSGVGQLIEKHQIRQGSVERAEKVNEGNLEQDNFLFAEYRADDYEDSRSSGTKNGYPISDYEKIKFLEQKKSRFIVLRESGEKEPQSSEYQIKICQGPQPSESQALIDSKTMSRENEHKSLSAHKYTNSRIIYNQSNMSANQSSRFRVHDSHSHNQEHQQYSQVHFFKKNKVNEVENEEVNKQSSPEKEVQFNLIDSFSQTGKFILSNGQNSDKKKKIEFQHMTPDQMDTNSLKASSDLSQIIAMGGKNSPSPFGGQPDRNPSKYYENIYLPTFNLVESIKFLSSNEEKLFSSSRLSPTKSQTSSDRKIENIIDIVMSHVDILSKMQQFVKMKDQMYEKQCGEAYEIQSFLLFRKFYQEREKIIESFEQPSSTFCIKGYQLQNDLLMRHKHHPKMVELRNKLVHCNQLILKTLKEYGEQIARNSPESIELISCANLSPQQYKLLMKLLNDEFEALLGKYHQKRQQLKNEGQGSQEMAAVCFRISDLMELTFILKNLQGKYIKKIEQEIGIEEFQTYLETFYNIYQESIREYIRPIQ